MSSLTHVGHIINFYGVEKKFCTEVVHKVVKNITPYNTALRESCRDSI